MIPVIFLVLFYVASATSAVHSKLGHLVVATRVSWGYLPEPMEIRERAITKTVDSLPNYSPALRDAVKARLRASYYFLYFLRPLIVIYGELSALYFIPGKKPARIALRLQSSLLNFTKIVSAIIVSLEQAVEILPGWTAALASSYDRLAEEAVSGVDRAHAVMNSLLVKQNLSNVYAARTLLLSSCIEEMIEPVRESESESLRYHFRRLRLTPLEKLRVMSADDTVHTAQLHYIRWSTRQMSKHTIEEANFLVNGNKKNRKRLRSMRSSVFTSCISMGFSLRDVTPQFMPWSIDSFPGDDVALDDLKEVKKNLKIASEARFQVSDRMTLFISSIIDKSLRVTRDDMAELEILRPSLKETGDAFADCYVATAMSCRSFVYEGLKYLG